MLLVIESKRLVEHFRKKTYFFKSVFKKYLYVPDINVVLSEVSTFATDFDG